MGCRRRLVGGGGFMRADVFVEPSKILNGGMLDPTSSVVSMQSHLMKFFRLISMVARLALFTGRSLHAELADGVKAVVNDSVITYSQVEEYTAPAAEALRRQYANSPNAFQQKLNDALADSLEHGSLTAS